MIAISSGVNLVAVITGIIGLTYLLKAMANMGNKLRKCGVYLSASVILFLIQSVGAIGLFQLKPELIGLWTSVTLLGGMIFLVVGFKKLSNAFN